MKEPSEAAIDAAIAMKEYDGQVAMFAVPTPEQTRSLIRNKLRAAYAVDFPDANGD